MLMIQAVYMNVTAKIIIIPEIWSIAARTILLCRRGPLSHCCRTRHIRWQKESYQMCCSRGAATAGMVLSFRLLPCYVMYSKSVVVPLPATMFRLDPANPRPMIASLVRYQHAKHSNDCCWVLTHTLFQYQHCVLRLVQLIIDDTIPDGKASRDFRVKYPDDLIQEGLAGQLWFGAEVR